MILQVLLNGRCVAQLGLTQYGLLTASVLLSRQNPERHYAVQQAPSLLCRLSGMAQENGENTPLATREVPLQIGDALTFQLAQTELPIVDVSSPSVEELVKGAISFLVAANQQEQTATLDSFGNLSALFVWANRHPDIPSKLPTQQCELRMVSQDMGSLSETVHQQWPVIGLSLDQQVVIHIQSGVKPTPAEARQVHEH